MIGHGLNSQCQTEMLEVMNKMKQLQIQLSLSISLLGLTMVMEVSALSDGAGSNQTAHSQPMITETVIAQVVSQIILQTSPQVSALFKWTITYTTRQQPVC